MNNNVNKDTKIEDLLVKYRSEDLTADESSFLEEWRSRSPENAHILEILERSSGLWSGIVRMYEYDKDRVWSAILKAEARRKRIAWIRRGIRFAAAASILFAFLSGWYLWHTLFPPDRNNGNILVSQYFPGITQPTLKLSDGTVVAVNAAEAGLREADNTIISLRNNNIDLIPSSKADTATIVFTTLEIPIGSDIYAVNLSDGTKVWLNSGSSLTFPTRFSEFQRKVELTGEAYFDVERDQGSEFVVESGDHRITVLGTSFNVAAYNDENRIETTLLSGSLQVNAGNQEVVLDPGQQCSYIKGEEGLDVKKAYTHLIAAWKDGYFVFFDESIESICRRFGRWYGLEFDIDPAVARKKFSGMLERYDTFNNIAELINATEEIVFKERGGEICVTAK